MRGGILLTIIFVSLSFLAGFILRGVCLSIEKEELECEKELPKFYEYTPESNGRVSCLIVLSKGGEVGAVQCFNKRPSMCLVLLCSY